MRVASCLGLRARAGDDLGEEVGELLETRTGDGGDLEHLVAAGLQVRADHLGEVLAVGDVDLVQDDEARTLLQAAAVDLELFLDDVEVGDRVAVRLQGRGVQDVHEDRAALDVAQELQAEALALAGAGIRPGTSAMV